MLALQFALPRLRARGGRAVTFSGGGGTSPLPRYDAYAASKAAVIRLTENLAAGGEIEVNAVAPGFVATRMHDETLRAGPEAAGQSYYQRTQRATARRRLPGVGGRRAGGVLARPGRGRHHRPAASAPSGIRGERTSSGNVCAATRTWRSCDESTNSSSLGPRSRTGSLVDRPRGPLSRERPAVFVDRDGVINELVPDPISGRPESPLRVDDVRLHTGRCGRPAGPRRRAAGALVGVSNQPSAAKGLIVARRAAGDPGSGPGAAGRRRRALRRFPALPAPSRGRGSGADRRMRLPQARAGHAARRRGGRCDLDLGARGWSATLTGMCRPGARPGAGRSSWSIRTAPTSGQRSYILTPSRTI